MTKNELIKKADLWLKLHGMDKFPWKGICATCKQLIDEGTCKVKDKDRIHYKGHCVHWLDDLVIENE